MYLLLSLYKQKCSYIFRYIYRCPVRPLPVRLLRSLASEREKNRPGHPQTCRRRSKAPVTVLPHSYDQFPSMVSLKRAVAHHKHVGGTTRCGLQPCWLTTNMPGEPPPLPALSAALRSQGYVREGSELAWVCGNKLYIYIYLSLSVYICISIHIYIYIYIYSHINIYLLLSLYRKKTVPIYLDIYNDVQSVLLQSVSSDRLQASRKKPARPPTNLPASLQGPCHHVATLMRSLPLQFLLSEPLLIANRSEGRPVAGSNRAGSPQTCQAASAQRRCPR